MTSPMTFAGPKARDELAEHSNANSWPYPLPPPLDMASLPWPGSPVHLPSGQRLFVRKTPRLPGGLGPGGETTLYIHGLGGSSTNWTAVAGLAAVHSTGLAVDLAGCGRSDPPLGGDFSIRTQVTQLAELIRATSAVPVHVVGNSYGGYVSCQLAARHPELVKSLTLIAPAVPDLRLVRDRGADPRLAMLLLPGSTRVVANQLALISAADRAAGMAALCFGDPSVALASDLEAAAADLEWRSELPWAHSAMIEQLKGLMREYLSGPQRKFWRAAEKVKVPTLVIWGTRDRLVDARLAVRTAEAFPNARLLIMKGAGHVPQMELPDATARAMLALWSQ
ncbi:alpha/beta hydrolase [Nakamurella antarctica]|uniref:Alpha/beta hydrolase n=1 Tax=Nakamurella antarctica TaxID=1902245 RepID=A0A3G8ZWV3_9ACTN|nr:alpha/beta hydrolase [Nakamurella antarctica]AZI58141.1 alpha/beta hydrolase [Nakamurella antarctica]